MANPKVTVEINGKDNLSPTLKKVNVNLKEMGEKVGQLGMRMSAAFTLPLVGAGMALNKFGSEAVKTVDDIQKQLNDAMASGDPLKITEAQAAYKTLSPEVIKAADAYRQMQAALAPVNAELEKTKATMLTALVPVIQTLAPLLIQAAQGLSNMAMQFAALPVPMQNFIIGGLAFIAAVGPMIVIVGQLVSTIGILKELMVSLPMVLGGVTKAAGMMGTVFGVAAGPVLALAAAIGALIYLINSGAAARAWTTLQQLVGIGLYKTGIISGDQFIQNSQKMGLNGTKANGGGVSAFGSYLVGERGPEILNMGSRGGSITPNHQLAGAGGGGVTIIYSPTISTASTDDIERMGKLIEQAQRRRP
jgi:hypothetical protein